MFADVVFFPDQASTTAHRVDHFFLFLVCVCGSVGLFVADAVDLFLRALPSSSRRSTESLPPKTPPYPKLEIFWTLTPLMIFMKYMFVWGAELYFDAYRAPDDSAVIYVVAKQWMWKFQHPEGQPRDQ